MFSHARIKKMIITDLQFFLFDICKSILVGLALRFAAVHGRCLLLFWVESHLLGVGLELLCTVGWAVKLYDNQL
jgi:hypothetical protein